jgi:hypothetical protein
MRVPSCFETPRWNALKICVRGRKARLLSMRAGEGSAFLAKRTQAGRARSRGMKRTNLHLWPSVVHYLRIVIYNENTNSNVWAVSRALRANAQHRDPSLPGLTRQSIVFEKVFAKIRMDPRVKPGGDERPVKALVAAASCLLL